MSDGDVTEWARALAARRKRVERTCPVCGKPAVGVGRKKYCSQACRQAAYMERYRDEPSTGKAKKVTSGDV